MKNGDQVVCQGRIQQFKDSLSLTAENIFRCQITFNPNQKPSSNQTNTQTSNQTAETQSKSSNQLPYPVNFRLDQVSQKDQYPSLNSLKPIDFPPEDSRPFQLSFFKGKTIVIYDLETTGVDTNKCEITQIAALKVVDGVEKQSFQTFVRTTLPIPKFVSSLTHITDEMIKDAPFIQTVIPEFHKFVDGALLVGHNSKRFDTPIINRVASECGEPPFNNEQFDTLEMARAYIPGLPSYKLTELSRTLNLEHLNPHSADSDVIATWGLLKKIIEKRDSK